MASYEQKNRFLRIDTALGKDAVLITRLSGTEGLSELFSYSLDVAAPFDKPVDFSKVLGQPAVVELDLKGGTRWFHGYINRFAQGARDANFIYYRADLVPQFWFLTKRTQSRIFQHVTVPEILKKVLDGLNVEWDLQGKFEPRDYCVQYRESDFDFACRLMEEEGIYWFFKHAKAEHKLVVANMPSSHPDLPIAKKLIYETVTGGGRDEQRITSWEKIQEIRSGKVLLWDHCFELPHKHLEAGKTVGDSVEVGTVTHKLKVGGADKLELYDYPGGYAQRFDGIDRSGSAQAAEVQKIFTDNARTAGIRMQEEAAPAVQINGVSDCAQMHSGFKFTLERHFDANGDYVLTRVSHEAALGVEYRSGQPEGWNYSNHFTCIPLAVPFRPQRVTPRPTVHGSQTAVVVGPGGDEIFTDKYGRVKVQFHWDRHGKLDADSSCWIRVATLWAGRNWGVIHIPRIGQEVVVDFLEGDPDQPIIVGSVYNADMMPPWALPGNKTQSGIQTRSSLGGSGANFNQIRFEDKKGSEQVHIHAEKNQDIEVEHDETHWVGHDRKKTIDHDETTHVKHDRTETVDNNETITVHGARTETVDKDETITIHSNRTETVDKNESITINGGRTETVAKDESITINGGRTESVAKDESITISGGRTENVAKDESITISGGRTENVAKDESITISGGRTESVAKDESITISGGRTESVAKDEGVTVTGGRTVSIGKDDTLTVGKNLAITAAESITLTTGSASITMKKDGTITITGKDITITGSGEIVGKASKTMTLKGQKILQN